MDMDFLPKTGIVTDNNSCSTMNFKGDLMIHWFAGANHTWEYSTYLGNLELGTWHGRIDSLSIKPWGTQFSEPSFGISGESAAKKNGISGSLVSLPDGKI